MEKTPLKTAIVTGAGSGIGRAAAIQLARRGFALTLVGRTAHSLDKTAAEIRALGQPASAFPADLRQSASATQLAAHALAEFGRIDVLVNAAGAVSAAPLAQTSDETWRDLLDANLSSAFFTTRALWPIMEAQNKTAAVRATAPSAPPQTPAGGTIINISSMATRDPFPGLGAYAAAKAALQMLTLVTAREGASAGIHALCLAPAAVDTPMFRGLMGNNPIDPAQVMQPADIAAVIADAACGNLRCAAGETIYLHQRPA